MTARPFNFDLHCHSTASDGVLGPRELVARAAANGVDVLALTDHDEVSGLRDAQEAADAAGITLVPGVEVSVTWGGITVHVVGLGVAADHEAMASGLRHVRSSRARRAEKISASLEAAGIGGALEGAHRYAENPDLIGRAHFARYLVEAGVARDVRAVFQRYLVAGKPGYVPHEWAELSAAVGWIRASGGRAVIAHPGRYKLSRTELRELFAEFKAAGGEAIEVVTGSHTPSQYIEFAQLARDFGFMASRGSDFHGPEESEVDLGRLPSLAPDLTPVWQDW